MKTPIIDIFAGPGGLGEGFSRFENKFKIVLSVEKDENAFRTLRLRSFFRQFEESDVPPEYFSLLRGEISEADLYEAYPDQAAKAAKECWRLTLGDPETPVEKIDKKISDAINGEEPWVLIGGPPCQAYSIAGRSRVGGISESDPRVHLYKEYLRIIAQHSPAVFVMENVKGLLSAKINGESIIHKIVDDLKQPFILNPNTSHKKKYRIYSLVKETQFDIFNEPVNLRPKDYLIESEKYGIPQSRHRIILLGIREDINVFKPEILTRKGPVPLKNVIGDLPKIRSGISRSSNDKYYWKNTIKGFSQNGLIDDIATLNDGVLLKKVRSIISSVTAPQKDRGAEFVRYNYSVGKNHYAKWYYDNRLGGICNHTARNHMTDDLKRYLFAASFAAVNKRSPKLEDFPDNLLPKHKNAKTGDFNDRFRVQVADNPASTITSHISKDGHYFIHYDPVQCRSLTVREAARIQTFPDNYFFCGSRTAQYVQVGNAVPPYLAWQIAKIVHDIIKKI